MTDAMAARNSRDYWAARAVQREREDYLKGSALSAKLFSEYERAAVELRKDINDFYGKYATRHGLTYDQAVRTLTGGEAREWRATLGGYVAQINAATDPKVKAAMVAQLDALSANSRISRLEALLGQAQLTLNDLYDRCVSELRAEFGGIYEAGYYRKHYDLQSRAGWINEIAKLDAGLVESAVNYPWSGAMFSDRLWRNKDALLFNVREILTQGLIQGKGLPETAKALSAKLGQSYKAAERLVRTETSHLHNEADKAAYLAAGVEEYEFVATLDARTCEVCGALDGKHFKLSEATPGENYPPMHPNDRCTTVEYDPDDDSDWAASGERMPESVTYEEWAKKQFTATEKSGIIETKGAVDMGIDVEIDQFTPCLLDRRTGKQVDTAYTLVDPEELEGLRDAGWLFDWRHKLPRDSEVYKLTLRGSPEIQGLIAMEERPKDLAYHVSLAESAPWNKGAEKRFEGVGGHLFAVAVQKSAEAGYGGFVYFEAKNCELVAHYREKFGAYWMRRPHEYSMIIDEDAAQKLIEAYTLEEGR